jgi:hypothetical protein
MFCIVKYSEEKIVVEFLHIPSHKGMRPSTTITGIRYELIEEHAQVTAN